MFYSCTLSRSSSRPLFSRLPLRLFSSFSCSPSAAHTPSPIAYIHQDCTPGPPELYLTSPDVFLADTHTLWTPQGARGVYGGHVFSTCMLAAERTLPQGCTFPLNSCQGYFLRPGSSALPTTYSVERLRDGRSFVTRSVTARQNGEAIFTLLASFHALEADASGGALGHQVTMPSVPGPEELLSQLRSSSSSSSSASSEKRRPPPIMPLHVLPTSGAGRPAAPSPTWPPLYTAWMAVAPLPPPSPATAHLHRAALAFASDWGMGLVSLLPYSLQWNSPLLQITASLDHSLHFHDSMCGGGAAAVAAAAAAAKPAAAAAAAAASAPRSERGSIARHPQAPPAPSVTTAPPQHADRYVLFEMSSSVLRGGRGMNSCRMWSQDGTLLCSGSQESLLRAK